jgi:hypothetical protein
MPDGSERPQGAGYGSGLAGAARATDVIVAMAMKNFMLSDFVLGGLCIDTEVMIGLWLD